MKSHTETVILFLLIILICLEAYGQYASKPPVEGYQCSGAKIPEPTPVTTERRSGG